MLPQAVIVAIVYGLIATKCFVSWAASFETRTGVIILDYRMSEELPAGKSIGYMAVDSGLTVEHGHSEAGSYRYSLFPSAFRDYFDVEATGGLLKTSEKSFDRDALCGNREVCTATLDVNVVKGLGQFQLVKVRILVEDLNDNSPLFQPDRLTLFVSEATLPGTAFLIAAASDLDLGEFGVKSYRLDGDRSRVLRLETTSPSTGARQLLRLILQEKMDRETERGLQLRITAADGGTPPRTGILTVNLVVQDANDNSPVFLKRVYTIVVEEGKAFEGVPLLQVSATDPDEGDNGRVMYDFDKATLASYGSDFVISNITGEIFLRRSLDFETQSSYELVVTASDMGLGSLPGSATIVVTVKDVNDNVPRIYVLGDSPHPTTEAEQRKDGNDTVHWVSVPENQSTETFIAQIFVTDEDSGKNGDVFCGTGSADFRLEKEPDSLPGLFKLTASVLLDREMRSDYTVRLHCSDRGIPSLESWKTVLVSLIDVNDNEPRFTDSEYVAELTEGSGYGVSLLTVTAVDGDQEENGRVSYHLLGNISEELVIDRDTGVIRTGLSPVDRETVESLVFSVIATDHGFPCLTAVVMVRVRIIDVNDVAPGFSDVSYTFFCAENLPSGTWVGTVSAVDEDQPPFNAFHYSIAVSSDFGPENNRRDDRHEPFGSEMNRVRVTDFHQGYRSTIESSAEYSNYNEIPFKIDQTSGRISTTRTLDREFQPAFSFIAVATDVEPPYLSSMVRVEVIVMDENDNPPVIQNLALITNVIIPLDTAAGSTVLRVAATDADDALNAKVHYSTIDGKDDDLFSIDPDNGDLRLARSPLSTSYNESYHLLVLVSDGGQPRLTANASISLTFSKGGSEKGLNSIGVALLRRNETVLLLVLGATSCVVAILIIAISYTKRLQSEEARAKQQAMYYDVRTVIVNGFGSNKSGSSSFCPETPSPLHSSDNDRSRISCLEECDTKALTSEEPSKGDSSRCCYAGGQREVQLRRKGRQVKNTDPQYLMQPTDAAPDSTSSISPPFPPSFGNNPCRTVRGQDHLSSRGSPLSSSRTPGPACITSAGIPRPRSSPGIRLRPGEVFLEDGLPKQRSSLGDSFPLAGSPVHPPRHNHDDTVKSPSSTSFHLNNGKETNNGVKKPSYHSNNNSTITGNLKWNSNADSGTLTSSIVPSWV